YHRGSLAIDSGLYESADTGYGKPHHLNYNRRTIAHNTLLIEDPAEVLTLAGRPIANDGGQRAIEGAMTLEDFWAGHPRTGRVLAHHAGPNPQTPAVSLIKGDLTAAYSDTKARRVTRTMAFFPLANPDAPAALVILDQLTTTLPEQRQVSLLHTIEEPAISGNVVTVHRTGPQMELLRWPSSPVVTEPDGIRTVFAHPVPEVVELRRAELWIPTRWALERPRVLLNGRPVELSTTSGAALIANVTTIVAATIADQRPLELRLEGSGARDALKAFVGPEAPHLRLWSEVAPARGKLVQTTLLPGAGAAEIIKVGGPGREFLAGGQNWEATPLHPPPFGGEEEGVWRVEVRTSAPTSQARFLQVYQVGDSEATLDAVRVVQGHGTVGASLAGRVLVASSEGDWLGDGAEFDLTSTDIESGSDTALVTLTDLPVGDHSLWRDGRIAGAIAVEAPSHTWVVRLRPGRYVLRSKLAP
ncbi:MAG TPA: hypothetical protein VHF69_03405, partial [Candidatus Synoicihabitans sp.]|nr:hypothetical protein [Candidatus Synoicihabitans sp.]